MNKKIIFFSILIGMTLGIVYLLYIGQTNTNFDDAALGSQTKSFYAKDDLSNSVHFMPKHNFKEFIKGLSRYEEQEKIIFLGNSQAHSINQLKPEDNTMSGYLFDRLINDSICFISLSIPNANLQEQYLLFNLVLDNLKRNKLLVLPIFMDDLREDGIREPYFSQFNDYQISDSIKLALEINQDLQSFSAGKNNDANTSNEKSDFEKDNKALNNTTQESVEMYLNQKLVEHTSFWDNRKEIRGKLFLNLYKVRNTVIGISAQTKRKMIPIRYKKNLNALKSLLEKAKRHEMKVILFIPPIRKDVEIPYKGKEYDSFKLELNELAQQFSVEFYDLDNIVKGEYWGFTDPVQLFMERDYDFMHYQAAGHKVLADSLEKIILKKVR